MKKQTLTDLKVSLVLFHIVKHESATVKGLVSALANPNPKTVLSALSIIHEIQLNFKEQ